MIDQPEERGRDWLDRVDRAAEDMARAEELEKVSALFGRWAPFPDQAAGASDAEESAFTQTPTPTSSNLGTWHGVDEDDEEEDEGNPLSSFVFRPRTTKFTRSPLSDDPEMRRKFTNQTQREREIGHRLIADYKASPDDQKLEHIYAHYEDLLDRTVRTYRNRRLPEAAIRGRVYNAFRKAIDRFEPGGKAFHNVFEQDVASNEVHKWANSYSNFGKVNWERARHLGRIQLLQNQFKLDVGREPTADEIKKETGLKLKDIRVALKEIRDDNVASKMHENDHAIDMGALYRRGLRRVRDTLSPKERVVFDDLYGYFLGTKSTKFDGKFKDLARQHGVSPSWVTKFRQRVQSRLDQDINMQVRTL